MSSRLTSESRIYADKAKDLNRQVSFISLVYIDKMMNRQAICNCYVKAVATDFKIWLLSFFFFFFDYMRLLLKVTTHITWDSTRHLQIRLLLGLVYINFYEVLLRLLTLTNIRGSSIRNI